MRNMPRLVSMGVLLALIVALGMTFFRVIAPFFLPLFLAAMTAIVCQPLYRYFLRRTKNHQPLAAGLLTGVVLSTGLLPILAGGVMASLQLYSVASELDRDSVKPVLRSTVQWGVDQVNRYRPQDQKLEAGKVTQDFSNWLRTSLKEIGDKSLGNAAGTTLGMLTGAAGFIVKLVVCLLMYSIALYYFFADGPKLLEAGEGLIPVRSDYQTQLLAEFSKVVRSVVIATFLAALAQGFATTVAIGILGFHHLVALFALASFAALIPLAGTWLVWLPCAIWLYSHGHPYQATGLVLYCIIFVGFIDNLIRTYVLNSSTKLHPLLAFVSVLGGIEAMGIWGVFIGPIVACCLHALVKIFNVELQQMSRDRLQEEMKEGRVEEEIPAIATVSEPAEGKQHTPSPAITAISSGSKS